MLYIYLARPLQYILWKPDLVAIHFLPPPAPKQTTPSVYTLSKAPSEDVKEEVEVRQRRTKLPCQMQDMGDFSLWSILRKNIGK